MPAEALYTPTSDPTLTTEALERGQIIYLPNHPFLFTPEEKVFLNPNAVAATSKTIKFSPTTKKIWGTAEQYKDSATLTALMSRYSTFARDLVDRLFPRYASSRIIGNASFRPVEAAGRVQSKRHDDQLLHIDSFPSRPTNGKRILRVFANVNPDGQSRRWQSGEPFAAIAARFAPHISAPFPGSASLMHLLKITKEKRSPYDHYMMHIHDAMKLDDNYQTTSPHTDIALPAGSTWIALTDEVSHAALSGQHAMEQTFLLPLTAMHDPTLSPLHTLETLKSQPLL
jgi:hypothetical protein